jgi:hypothetical protein
MSTTRSPGRTSAASTRRRAQVSVSWCHPQCVRCPSDTAHQHGHRRHGAHSGRRPTAAATEFRAPRGRADRGYECLLLSDCTGATDPGNYRAALEMVEMQGGVFGAVTPSAALLASLKA